MLLMSARVPIFGRNRRASRRGGRLGDAGPLIARNVATKPWHMACVVGRDIVANGESRLGRGATASVSGNLHNGAGDNLRSDALSMRVLIETAVSTFVD